MSATVNTAPGPNDRIAVTLLFAAALHALIILGVGFEYEPPNDPPRRLLDVEIITVTNPQPAKKVKQADFLAQTNQEGGGKQEQAVRPKAPAKLPDIPVADLPAPQARREQPKAQPVTQKPPPRKPVVTQNQAVTPPASAKPPPPPPVKERARPSRAQLFSSLQREIDRQSAELTRITQRIAKRPRRKVINASTQEYRYANYLDSWRRKIERIGNLNYPEEAKRRQIYGDLLLRVSVRTDGSVAQIKVLRSSGKKVLDDAAIRIVKLAAPFPRFPENIRSEVDMLDIVRTWQFLDTDKIRSR